jgi:thioredoxin-related protein
MKVFMFLIIALLAGVDFTGEPETTCTATDPEWITLETALNEAADTGNTIFLFVEADWCGLCKRMKNRAFQQPETKALLSEQFHLVTLDLDSRKKVTYNSEEITERELARKLEVMATPGLVFLYPDGSKKGLHNGYLDEDDFYRLLRYVQSDQFYDVSFSGFSID